MAWYVAGTLTLVMIGCLFLRFGARPMARRTSIESILFLFMGRKYGIPVMYVFFVLAACIHHAFDKEFATRDQLFGITLFTGFMYGLSGVTTHWFLNDLLSDRFKSGRKVSHLDLLRKSIRRWRRFHKFLFHIKGLSARDVFTQFDLVIE